MSSNTKLESTHSSQSKASSRRVTLLKQGWKDVRTTRVNGQFEVWGEPPVVLNPSGKQRAVSLLQPEPKEDKPRRKHSDPGPRGQPVGVQWGLRIEATWVRLLSDNEKAPDGRKLSDTEISQFMKREFPNRPSKVFERVQYVRAKYNRGGFKCGTPSRKSKSYGA